MAKFIQITNDLNGKQVCINLEHVVRFEARDEKTTLIILSGGDESVLGRESYADVYRIFRNVAEDD